MRSAEAIRTKKMGRASEKPGLRVVKERESARRRRKARPKRYLIAVSNETRDFDPIHHSEGVSKRSVVLLYVIGAAVLHGLIFVGLVSAPDTGDTSTAPVEKPETVTLNVTDPKPVPPPQPVPEPETVAEPEPESAAPETPPRPVKQPSRVKPLRRTAPTTPDVAVDPVNIPDTPPSPAEPRRRVVGINFESTVNGGNGPAFAVGNTRMGETGRTAEDGKRVDPLAGRAYQSGGKQPSANRVSAAVPTAGVQLTKPKRLSSLQPAYPPLLKKQGIEGNVAVLIRIDETGKVVSAKVVKGSGYSDFDAAAEAAALKERFSPAVRNGEAIAYTLKYTYRFRVREQ